MLKDAIAFFVVALFIASFPLILAGIAPAGM